MKAYRLLALAILAATLAGCTSRKPSTDDTVPPPQTTGSTAPTGSEDTAPPTDPTIEPTDPPAVEPEDEDFVLLSDYVPNLRTHLYYATTENFTGQVIYDFQDAYLRYGTAMRLKQAALELEKLGYGILIWDGYRPLYAQQRLWDAYPDPTFVSKPGTGNQRHCRGMAVDMTLYDLATGEELEMPTGFDDFSSKADRDYSDCTAQAAQNAKLLEDAMIQAGFKPYSKEWWHFNDTHDYPIEERFDPAEKEQKE